jgi:signal transduction histidine kinase
MKKNIFSRLSLSRQFLMVSFPILLAGTLAIGWWIGRQVEDSVVHRIGSVTALYVDSFVAPHVQTLMTLSELSPHDRDMLRADLNGTPLGKKIVALKIWRKDGYVLFSNDAASIGKKFSVDEGLETALSGSIFSEISERSSAEQAEHGQPMARLIETYTPIHADRTGDVIAAAEFYVKPDDVDREAGAAQRRSWLLVAGAMLTIYLWLFWVVSRGSRTIEEQQSELSDKVHQLTILNEQNMRLQERVIGAAERATALNENFLQRLSADIHDGPGQDLGYALMQLKNLADMQATPGFQWQMDWIKGLEPARLAVESALRELRAMSADIELPDIAQLGPQAIAARVVRDFQVKTGTSVLLLGAVPPIDVAFRVKVALYRVLQESLANTVRHAQGKDCRVELSVNGNDLTVEISDKGPGFDPRAVASKGRLGLHGMRQRIEVLGGSFELQTQEGSGTAIRVTFPLIQGQNDKQ